MNNSGSSGSHRPGLGRARARLRTRSPAPSEQPGTSSISSSSGPSRVSSSPVRTVTADSVSQKFETMQLSESGQAGFPRGALRGQKRERDYERGIDYVCSRPKDLVKKGSKGKPIEMRANFFTVKKLPSWCLHQYRVDFDFKEDFTPVLKRLFRDAFRKHEISYMFDGTQLFIAKTEDCIPMEYTVPHKTKEGALIADVRITLKYIQAVHPGSPVYIQLYNILIKKCLFGLGLEEMGRNFFDPEATIKLDAEKLELWPGYVTSIRTHENETLLCVEVTHKVLRMSTVLENIRVTDGSKRDQRIQKTSLICGELKDTVVMTTYNRKTYHVDDIDFDQNPLSTFDHKGRQVTYVEFYKMRYNIDIKDTNQPLIVSRPSKRDLHKGTTEVVFLIPELCRSTGLTDNMRSNFQLMKKLGVYLHQGAQQKIKIIEKFMARIKNNAELVKELNGWGLEFDNKLVDLRGRILPSEQIQFATGTQAVDAKGDFTMAFRSQKMISTVNLTSWALLCPKKDKPNVDNLVKTMSKVSAPLNMRVSNPKLVLEIADFKIQSYVKSLNDVVTANPDLQMIFVILPTNKLDLYSAVKKKLAVDVGVPSQCFLSKNVTNKGLMSIATKVVVQMNAKLGGEPWSVKLPLKGTMMVGFDVYKGGKGAKGGSIGAMVATISPNFTKYYSTTSTYNDSDELSRTMRGDIKKCLLAYREVNGTFPEVVIMFRDGVGDGQLKQVYTVELASLKEELASFYRSSNQEPAKLTYIVVTKKINARVYETKSNGPSDNPPPGTVVDDVITLPERYDFYLISCTARQGTVSPCSYNVLVDESRLGADKIQLLTYKMCHMYYNWSGTVSVPAPCQYAHKLAFITGMAYTGRANEKLSKLLHFL